MFKVMLRDNMAPVAKELLEATEKMKLPAASGWGIQKSLINNCRFVWQTEDF
jgi:hypothetical protein